MTTSSLMLMKHDEGIVFHASHFDGVAIATVVSAPCVGDSSGTRVAEGLDGCELSGRCAPRRTPSMIDTKHNEEVGEVRSEFEPETLAVRQLQTAMADAEAALGQRLGMNPTDLAALAHITWSTEPVGPGDLAQFLNISPGAASELVDRLTAAGQVERRRDLADRRRVRLQPSGKATALMIGHIAPLVHGVDAASRGFSAEDRQVILRFLGLVIETYVGWTEHHAGPETPLP